MYSLKKLSRSFLCSSKKPSGCKNSLRQIIEEKANELIFKSIHNKINSNSKAINVDIMQSLESNIWLIKILQLCPEIAYHS